MTETTLSRVADECHTGGFDLVSHHNRQPRLTTRIRALSHIQKLALEHSRREKEGTANGSL